MNKTYFRDLLKKTRAEISRERREEAGEALLTQLLPSLLNYEHILSFASFSSEIDTSALNRFLVRTNRLLLPKIGDENLEVYHITDLSSQLTLNSFGLCEPNPQKCEKAEHQIIQLVLVPALGFDRTNHRLGYGKGYYDRFLQQIPHAKTEGIGFKEQFVETLPLDTTDISLQKVSLF